MNKSWLAAALLLVGGCNAVASLNKVTLRGETFTVELATDAPSREHGLMMRASLPSDHGMLFVFPRSGPQGFWMKNTLIPLDILYFNDQRQLVSVQRDVPPCKADPCPTYPSAAPARYVLELAAGTAARIGVRAGDELQLEGSVGEVE